MLMDTTSGTSEPNQVCSLISQNGYCTKDIWSRIEMGKKVCGEKEIVYWYNESETEEENKILCV